MKPKELSKGYSEYLKRAHKESAYFRTSKDGVQFTKMLKQGMSYSQATKKLGYDPFKEHKIYKEHVKKQRTLERSLRRHDKKSLAKLLVGMDMKEYYKLRKKDKRFAKMVDEMGGTWGSNDKIVGVGTDKRFYAADPKWLNRHKALIRAHEKARKKRRMKMKQRAPKTAMPRPAREIAPSPKVTPKPVNRHPVDDKVGAPQMPTSTPSMGGVGAPQMPTSPFGQLPQLPFGQSPIGQLPQPPIGQLPQLPFGQLPQMPTIGGMPLKSKKKTI